MAKNSRKSRQSRKKEKSRAAGAKLEHNHIINKRVMEGSIAKKKDKIHTGRQTDRHTYTYTNTQARTHTGHSLEQEMEMEAERATR